MTEHILIEYSWGQESPDGLCPCCGQVGKVPMRGTAQKGGPRRSILRSVVFTEEELEIGELEEDQIPILVPLCEVCFKGIHHEVAFDERGVMYWLDCPDGFLTVDFGEILDAV